MENTNTPDPIVDALPSSWQLPVTIGLFLIPLLGRAYYAVKTGGGLKGIWKAIMFGTNQPKVKMIALLLMGAGLFSACTSQQQVTSTTITGVEVSGSTVRVSGKTHLNIPYDKVDSATTAFTKNIFVIKNVIPDSTGVGLDWIATIPGINK